MEVLTNRLRITELTMEMAEAIHADSLDDATRRFLPDEVFETVEEARETVAFLMSWYDATDGPLVYAVIRQEDGGFVGYVQMVPMVEGTYEIGYHIGERYRGNGYAEEAVRAFLPVMAKTLGISEVYGISLKENAPSCKVLANCGFETVFEEIGYYQGNQREIVKSIWTANGR
ncbi:MAG: GNAT family N-acetyltransferase [Clostridiales bacterium]|nr:GNAT family N-acetyltransferase [Clostridiales bacterium]